jgi:mono/diheme cytochrome c family protein
LASSAVGQRSTWSGVYSKAQARRGLAVYARACASCHGPTLQGAEQAAPLTGAAFSANWDGRTLGELFELMRQSMPGDDPGTLTAEQNADVLAYMLSVGNFPAGDAALSGDRAALDTITFATKR